jgi:hypothetical protein
VLRWSDEEGKEDGLVGARLEDKPYLDPVILQQDVLVTHEGLLALDQRPLLEEGLKADLISADVGRICIGSILSLL